MKEEIEGIKQDYICTEDYQECEKCPRTVDNCMVKFMKHKKDKNYVILSGKEAEIMRKRFFKLRKKH